MTSGSTRAAILAVDGGNSKADVALIGSDGTLLAAVHGPSISHQAVGLETGMANLRALVAKVAAEAGIAGTGARGSGRTEGRVAALGSYCLAGADYRVEERLLHASIDALGLTEQTLVRNDTFAALRAGTDRPWGVALICGRGINGAAVAPDGRTARFDGLGHISGDWGGGRGIGTAGLGAAVRARDGRGPRTLLERLVPEHFGLKTPAAVTRALYEERIDDTRLTDLAPVVFRAAAEGDAVARGILTRLSTELAAMAGALIRRLALARLDPEVVLAGGVFQADDPIFYGEIEAGVLAVAPRARIVRLTAPPVLGAALIGLDRLSKDGATPAAVDARLRAALVAWRGRP
ncbi:MAG TPA: BadF/BadG/BcrA/BcrD ATPase family protein [Candidatus Dormibacteraeota bacterium]|nr:BadF/BadG/BcrA/BcrD ATPase family protein [Candidatus Dormibacteraeota bacterium]